MRNQTVRHVVRFLAPRILAALTIFWAVDQAAAADARFNNISDTQVEITGGAGKETWRLRYGTGLQAFRFKPHFVACEGNRAWYSFGGWLRLIDTEKGVVIGRWRFPAEIVNLTPEGTRILVEIEELTPRAGQNFNRKLELDPSNPHVPYWPTGFLTLYRVPISEGQMIWPSVIHPGASKQDRIPAEEAKRILPELEEAVRRDPFTPWFRVGLGRVLKDMGDPRAAEAFQDAIKIPGTDFTELLPISVYFDAVGDNNLARAAFERGYRDFWERGNDPRLLTALSARLFIYAPKGSDWGNAATPHVRELIERVYKLMPYGQGADLAWRGYADYLIAHGLTDDARLWRARANDAAQNRWLGGMTGPALDILLIATLALIMAVIFYAAITYGRYRPQRRLDRAAGRAPTGFMRISAFLNAQYWTRRERVGFLIVVFFAWFGIGLTAQCLHAVLRRAALPVGAGAGSFAGPVTIARFQNGLPASPERDLMLAFAYQQDGQTDKAAELYRRLPQFAQSWNNLGVILKEARKDDEARAAFTRALELDPKLAEAALNLGRPPADFWTEQYHRYLPGKPMLAPPRGSSMQAAFLGGSMLTVCLRALEGPYYREGFGFSLGFILGFASNWGAMIPSDVPSLLLTFLFIYCIALIFLIPSREVSVPPEKLHTVWEVLLPGTSPAWGALGGLAMASFIYFVIEFLLIARLGTPYFVTMIATPNLAGAYGVPIGTSFADVIKLMRPSWVWMYGAAAVLFAVNLFLVLRARRRA